MTGIERVRAFRLLPELVIGGHQQLATAYGLGEQLQNRCNFRWDFRRIDRTVPCRCGICWKD